jgi:hypothetical protein
MCVYMCVRVCMYVYSIYLSIYLSIVSYLILYYLSIYPTRIVAGENLLKKKKPTKIRLNRVECTWPARLPAAPAAALAHSPGAGAPPPGGCQGGNCWYFTGI